MVTINLDSDDFIESVYHRYQDGTYPLNEQGVSFLLGYHLAKEDSSKVWFEIGVFGPLEASFSPDLDILALDDDLAGYEVKGIVEITAKSQKDSSTKGLGKQSPF